MKPLFDKAQLLLSRRDTPSTVGYYIKQAAGRHLLFSVAFWLLIVVAWLSDMQFLAYITAGFWAGRLVRDVQWYQRLSTEWESTRELVDWQKVEAIVGDSRST